MRIIKLIHLAIISCCTVLIILAIASTPASGKMPTIDMARPTWTTGWFQAEICKQLLEELGYRVREPQTKKNRDFYLEAASGKIDFWVNGWLPSHQPWLDNDLVHDKVKVFGSPIKGQAVQGYLVDKKTAQQYQITSIEDLQDPKIAKLFDRDGNGKADLIGCNVDWNCAKEIDYHLDVTNLRDSVEQIRGDYSLLMNETMLRHQKDEPILFYTWTPNWTIGNLIPDRDVVWLQVPFPSLPQASAPSAPIVALSGIVGCSSDPCLLGFPPAEIRAVGNRDFLAANPAAEKLLELVKIPLEDITAQNARFYAGENSRQDLRRQAKDWIANNREAVNLWLTVAKDVKLANRNASEKEIATANEQPNPINGSEALPDRQLQVITKRFEPLVTYENGEYLGFSIDLWKELARELDLDYELRGVDTLANLLDSVKLGTADVAIAGITITAQREEEMDFSHPFFDSGLQIMILDREDTLPASVGTQLLYIIRRPGLYYGIGFFLLTLLAVAHLIWFFERGKNPDFPTQYVRGIWESLWWATVTVTTVGYGDKTPKNSWGRIFGLIWMCVGYFVFAYFTATLTTTFTVQELQNTIAKPEDLKGAKVATVKSSTAAQYLRDRQLNSTEYDSKEEAYLALEEQQVDAIVYDAPALQYYAQNQGKSKVKVVGSVFQEQRYGIAFPINSQYRKLINTALLKLIENGVYQEIYRKWFGVQIDG